MCGALSKIESIFQSSISLFLDPGVIHPEDSGEEDSEGEETHDPLVEEEERGTVHDQVEQNKHSCI